MKVYARNNQVFMASTFTMLGASMPSNGPAAMAVSIAEALSAIALSQIIRPGAPAILGIPGGSMSMRTGAPVLASPQISNFMLLAGQMSRFYKLPLRVTSHPTSSKWADMYAGIDATLAGFATHVAGANFLVHSAGMIDGLLTMSYMKFGIDIEITEIMHELMLGMAFEDAGTMVEMIKNVEPGGHFIGEDYTRTHLEFTPRLQDYNTYEQWHEEGSIKADERGLEHTKRLLDSYRKPELGPQISQALDDFVDRRTKEINADI
jgi:trimethylamine--corrinoid protein Co-methyltransferase